MVQGFRCTLNIPLVGGKQYSLDFYKDSVAHGDHSWRHEMNEEKERDNKGWKQKPKFFFLLPNLQSIPVSSWPYRHIKQALFKNHHASQLLFFKRDCSVKRSFSQRHSSKRMWIFNDSQLLWHKPQLFNQKTARGGLSLWVFGAN